ncbi:DMT family transporter [Clostridium intestinale]|uniref:DMT family transporter n=1 Tax=Clostridium intestinale TaxID=36845 RepID=A0A7D6W3R4_9CLOT|nr:DMT family transporter [Clostridium intestinale]QLY82105.1 DMT family transporter [Clostridium intestinale]
MKIDKKIIPYFTALITNIIFGLSFLFTKKALMVSNPITLVAFRFLLAFIIMSLLIAFKVIKVNYKNKPMKWLIVLAIIEPIIYFIFETYGLQRTSSSLGGLMIALIPIVVTILAIYFLNEKPSRKQVLSIILSVSGVVLIILMDGSKNSGNSILGVLFLSVAVFSAAFFNIIARKISKHFTAIEVTYFMMFLGAIFFNIVSVSNHILNGSLSNYFEPLKSSSFVLSILYLGILSSIVAYFLANFTLSKMEASKSAIFANISTIVSIIAGVIFLKENFHLYHTIGSAMILMGVWGTNYYK